MAGNALEILQIPRFCERLLFWNGYVRKEIKVWTKLAKSDWSPPAPPPARPLISHWVYRNSFGVLLRLLYFRKVISQFRLHNSYISQLSNGSEFLDRNSTRLPWVARSRRAARTRATTTRSQSPPRTTCPACTRPCARMTRARRSTKTSCGNAPTTSTVSSSKSTFSRLFVEKCISQVVRIGISSG